MKEIYTSVRVGYFTPWLTLFYSECYLLDGVQDKDLEDTSPQHHMIYKLMYSR